MTTGNASIQTAPSASKKTKTNKFLPCQSDRVVHNKERT